MLTWRDKVWISVKAAYLRITLTKFTIAFFLFGFIHCFAQGMIQSFIYTTDTQYSSFISTIMDRGEVPVDTTFAWLRRPGGIYDLQLCHRVPRARETTCNDLQSCPNIPRADERSCNPIFATSPGLSRPSKRELSVLMPRAMDTPHSMHMKPDLIEPLRNSSGGIIGVSVSESRIDLDRNCTLVLMYPHQVLKNWVREDLSLIAVQFWLFSVSFIAIIYDSVPHTLAVLCARVLSTGWSAYTLWRTSDIEIRFFNLVMKEGSPCRGVDFFSGLFSARMKFEVGDLVLNLTALIISACLSSNLLKTYSAQVFKRVGPPKDIVRIYRYFLAIYVCLQLSIFFLVTAVCLWFDQLMKSAFFNISSFRGVYYALFICTICLIIPWITTGWISIRKERKHLMTGFLVIAFIFLVCWLAMFKARTYRWTFIEWPFLVCMTLVSYITIVGSFIFGIMSWLNFGKGFSSYLNIEDNLQKTDFEHEVFPTKGFDVESKGTVETDKSTATESIPSFYLPTLHSDQIKAEREGIVILSEK